MTPAHPYPNLIVLYVESAAASLAFYSRLTGIEPGLYGPDFKVLPLPGGAALGLWSKRVVNPSSNGVGARSELVFSVENAERVQALYDEWRAMGLPIEQELSTQVFGPTFVAKDPDGHRLRVVVAAA